MKGFCFFSAILVFLVSCKSLPSEDRHFSDIKNPNVLHLKINPQSGSVYRYDVTNESKVVFKLEEKEIININKSQAGVLYEVSKDSMGNFIFNITYDKIKLYTKNRDAETDLDAANADISLDPLEKLLGIILKSKLKVTLSPRGEMQKIDGYKDMSDQILSKFSPADEAGKKAAIGLLEKFVKEEMIQRNIDQIFKIFPDSAVHIRDKWQITSKYPGEISMNIKTNYILNDIDEKVASIAAEALIESDSANVNYMGYDVGAGLKGQQSGLYEIEITSGMLKSCRITGIIKGNINVLARELPVTIETNVKMRGEKIK
ncbi:MAG TPA: DUF6263 family protein [Chitinophagaceae bacterium]|nr:DUF6263 family protein [Chitinophagaceae bacterium]